MPKRIRIVLLPGLHGTPDLFDSFVAQCPPQFEPVMVGFPSDRVLTYETLATEIQCQINSDAPFVLLGESFSGPLALRLAADRPAGLIGVVLVATFVRPPAPGWLRWLPWDALFRFRTPLYVLRALLTGSQDAAEILRRTNLVIRNVHPRVLAGRVRSVLTVDARSWLRSCPVPILYLMGSRDRLVRRYCLDEILTHRSDVIQRCVPTPHFLLQLAPTEAWTAIHSFVAEQCHL
jgi:pimeloyl-[acyl-carrier protein] methyl ester esterase